MNDLRKIIRDFIFEALDKQHFRDRVHDRLESEHTTFKGEKEDVKKKIMNDIAFLKKVNFPGQDNIGILLFKGANNYVYQQEVGGKLERSAGNFVWVVIRANDLETIVFGDYQYVPRNTQIQLNIDKLKKYIEQRKNMDFNLTEKDLRVIQTWNPDFKPQQKVNDDVILNIGGVKYAVDKERKELYKKNNPKERVDIASVFESLPEADQERVFDYL